MAGHALAVAAMVVAEVSGLVTAPKFFTMKEFGQLWAQKSTIFGRLHRMFDQILPKENEV